MGDCLAAIWRTGLRRKPNFPPRSRQCGGGRGTVTVKAEVPGFEVKDLEVTLEPQRLVISGKRETKEETKKGKTVYKEQCSNEIFRAVPLPAEVDASKATATLKNGVLELQVPKSAKATTEPCRGENRLTKAATPRIRRGVDLPKGCVCGGFGERA